MAKIEISAIPVELEAFGEQWDAVAADLESKGHNVTIVGIAELRSGAAWLDMIETDTIQVAIDIDEDVHESPELVQGTVVEAVRRHLFGRLGASPRAVAIINPSGAHLLTVVPVRAGMPIE